MVAIVPYDASWPREFDRIATGLRSALGGHALRVDHVGSTSVPNLSAKDVIDIQVTVKEFVAAISDALQDAGFVPLPDLNALLVRDFLRANPEIAAAYAELKSGLATVLANPADYAEVKDPAVDLIYFAAEAWAVRSGWRPEP